jgi:molybdate transport system substrate-binding protein
MKLLSTLSAQHSLREILPAFERESGVRIEAEYVGASAFKSRSLSAGEADVFIGPDELCTAFRASRILSPEGGCEIGVSRSAAAIPAHAPCPSVETSEQLVEYLLALPTVCYGGGASAVRFVEALRRHGAEDAILAKRVIPRTGEPVGDIVARGDAAFGVQQLSELMPVAGIQLIRLPAEFEVRQTYSACRFSDAADTGVVDSFFEFLRSEAVATTFRRNGFQTS